MYALAGGGPTDMVPPAGWTQIGTTTQVATGGVTGKFSVWWKRAASSEPSTYSFDHWETPTNQGVIAAYSGVTTSGDPIDVFSQATGNSTAATYSGITTTVSNTGMVLVGHNWDGAGTLTPPTGMTERFDGIVYAADEAKASAGATGDRSHTVNSGPDPWAGFLVALKPAAFATAYTINAVAGSYGLTGTDAIPAKSSPPGAFIAVAEEGVYALTGTAASLFKTVAAETGSYAIAGTSAAPTLLTSLPLYRSHTVTTYGTNVNTVVTKPTGAVNNDILIAAIWVGLTGTAPTVTAPAGWTQIGIVATSTAAGFGARFYVYWKRASGEGASYTFTHASAFSLAVMAAYSGCVATGSPIEAFGQNTSTSSVTNAPSVTTQIANDLLLYVSHNWDTAAALTPPTGMTERQDGLLYFADERISSGATSSRVQTVASNPWTAFSIALMPPRPRTPFAPPPINPAVFLPFLVR